MHVLDDHDGPTCVAFLKGSADLAHHEQFQKAMAEAEQHPSKFIVLDIRELTFLTSLAVGEILKLYKAKKKNGGNVMIAGANQYIDGVFKAARLNAVMPIVPTVDEAVAACGKA